MEKCSEIHVVGDKKIKETFEGAVEKKQVEERRFQMKKEEMFLHKKYVGTCFYK